MIVNIQKPIEFINKCGAIFDEQELAEAIVWYSDKPVTRLKTVYMHAKYPTVSIYFQKIQIHRLLMMYRQKEDFDSELVVHHVNHNKLDASVDNLVAIPAAKHGSHHNKGKVVGQETRAKIAKANKNRKGMKLKKRVQMPDLIQLKEQGWSINKIANHYGCDWTTVKARLTEVYEHPHLLEQK